MLKWKTVDIVVFINIICTSEMPQWGGIKFCDNCFKILWSCQWYQ